MLLQHLTDITSSTKILQVITLAGELLDKAANLLHEGLTTTEVADGYERAAAKVRIAASCHHAATSEYQAFCLLC